MGNTISEELEPQDMWWNPPQITETTPVQSVPSSSIMKNTENNTNDVQAGDTEDSEVLADNKEINTKRLNSDENIDEQNTNETQTCTEEISIKIVEEITEKLIKNLENTNTCDTSPSCSTNTTENITNEFEDYKKQNQEKMDQFRSELAKKHLARRQAIAERSKEILFLREELAKQKKDNEDLREQINKKEHIIDTSWNEDLERLKEENEGLKTKVESQEEELKNHQEILQNNHELRLNLTEVQSELQNVNSQVVAFEKERLDYQTHVAAMKDVVKVSKQLLEIREHQLEDLRAKVAEIESNLADQESSMLATNLRNEYEKQLRNMRALRTLYEQRQAATKAEKDSIASELADTQSKLETEQSKTKELEERVEELEKAVSDKYDTVLSLESQLGLVQAECRGLQVEMAVINQLFSQILVGFNNGQVDLDKLIKLLEENHDLLTEIVINEESMEHISALPKTLLDLIDQVQAKKAESEESIYSTTEESISSTTEDNLLSEQQATGSQVSSAAEIVQNLPKVWRVLAELLSQQSGQQPVIISDDSGIDPCYKSIETPKGPQVVLSVSQTFIRLKDLILEKKSLEKEMTRLKQLNTHLEVRLQDQEKRLETVSTELSKTWHVVGRMQRQHQQLHTHEKILRYELAQKRKMLNELKQELEYCREKWEQAREKNSNTEEQWKKLRTEFASRKATITDDLNNSAESGYSDERECSSDDDSYNPNKKIPKTSESYTEDIVEKSDAEDNHDISESDDDLLESAFNKACSQALPQPNLTLAPVFDLTESSSGNSMEVMLHSNIETEATENDNTQVQVLNLESRQTSHKDDSQELIQTESSHKDDSQELIQTESSHKDDSQELLQTESSHTDDSQVLIQTECNTESSQIEENSPSTSQNIVLNLPSTSQEIRTSEEMLAKREERLRRLEEQCKQLVRKVTNTTNRGVEISSRLTTLHEQYSTTQNENTENSEETNENTQQENRREENTREKNTQEDNTREENTQEENTQENTRDENTREENTQENTREENTREENTQEENTQSEENT